MNIILMNAALLAQGGWQPEASKIDTGNLMTEIRDTVILGSG
jgi:hypothetical protein